MRGFRDEMHILLRGQMQKNVSATEDSLSGQSSPPVHREQPLPLRRLSHLENSVFLPSRLLDVSNTRNLTRVRNFNFNQSEVH